MIKFEGWGWLWVVAIALFGLHGLGVLLAVVGPGWDLVVGLSLVVLVVAFVLWMERKGSR